MSSARYKYIILILSIIFFTFSIYYFQMHVHEIGLRPYNNLSSDKMTSNEEFILNVKKDSRVFLLHNAKIGAGYVEFKMTGEDGQLVDQYRLTKDSFIKKTYDLSEGIYHCIIKRDVEKNSEQFRFYYDKRFINQKYLNKDYNTSNYTSSN